MRWVAFLSLFLLLLGCQSDIAAPEQVVTACTATTGETVEILVDEPTTGVSIPVGVYLPPCYAELTGQHYPVIYLFSGGRGSRLIWPQWGLYEVAEAMLAADEIQPFILVTPEANPEIPGLERVIAETIVPAVDEQFRTISQPDHRFAGGASFGGALSWQLAVQYPELFGGAGLFGAAGLVGRWQEEAAALLAAIPDDQTPFFYFDVGRDDAFVSDAADYQALLAEHGFIYTHVSRAGRHQSSYWQQSIPEYLLWFNSVVGQQAYRWQVVTSGWEVASAKTALNCGETQGTSDRSLVLPNPAVPGINQPVVVYLPPCYHADEARHYPVFYFLHGLGGRVGGLEPLLDELLAVGDVPPFIAVMPSNADGYDEIVPWIGEVLVPTVDSTYRTVPLREYRGVGGPSRGGGLTLAVGIAYPELFGQLGLYMSAHIHTDEQITDWLDRMPPDKMPLINISIGEDDTLLVDASESIHRLLLERHIPHQLTVRPGGHDFVFWNRANQLEFYGWQAAAFGHSLIVASQ